VWVPQRIHDYLCVVTGAIAIYLVGKVVEYVEEHHKVTPDSKAIMVDGRICETTKKSKIAPVERLLRFRIEQLETMHPCLRRWLDLFVVRIQLSLPRPLSERVGEVELRKSGY